MAITARLPEALKAEADAYAAGLGISLNALLAVALRDYLDARRPGAGPRPVAAEPSVSAPAAPVPAPAASAPDLRDPYALAKNRACHCGSGRGYAGCHFERDRSAWRLAGKGG